MSTENKHNSSLAFRFWMIVVSIILILFAIALFASYNLKSIAQSTDNLYQHPYAVSNAVRNIQYHVIAINRSIKNIALMPQITDINHHIHSIKQHEAQAQKSFIVIYDKYLGNKSDIDKIDLVFKQWAKERKQIIQFAKLGQVNLVQKLALSTDINYVSKIEHDTKTLLLFADNKAVEFLQAAQLKLNQTIQTFWVLTVILSIFILIIGWLTIKNIAPPIQNIAHALKALSLGEIDFEWHPSNRNDELGRIEESLNALKTSTIYMTNHARNIANGYYNLEVKMRSDNDVLGLSMAKMSQSLKATLFINKGMSGLNNVIRGNLSLDELSQNILNFICHYTETEMACLYIVKDKNIHCISTYAFPYGEQTKSGFMVGEGLVGEAALQKKTMTYSNVNNDYLRIESAIGSTRIKTTNIIPILRNDEAFVLVELGRMSDMQTIHHHWLQTASVTIAETLNTAMNRENAMGPYLNINESIPLTLQTKEIT